MVTSRSLSSGLVAAALLLVPLAIWFEHSDARVWNERLWLPSLEQQPNLHTPRHTTGQFLPAQIATDTTLSPDNGVVILTTQTAVAPGVTVTLLPGTRVVAHEFAGFVVQGSLHAIGSESEPILFTTNEQHTLNQVWTGITYTAGSSGSLQHVKIEHASPGVSCLAESSVTISAANIENGRVGLYTESPQCTLQHSRIRAVNDGVVARDVEPDISTVTFATQGENVRIISPKGD